MCRHKWFERVVKVGRRKGLQLFHSGKTWPCYTLPRFTQITDGSYILALPNRVPLDQIAEGRLAFSVNNHIDKGIGPQKLLRMIRHLRSPANNEHIVTLDFQLSRNG